MKSPVLVTGIHKKGFRATKLREALVDVFLQSPIPLSVPEIITVLEKRKIYVNKSTIYRQLEFLIEQNLVRQVDLRERGRKFEYNLKDHHHHLVCIKCKGIEDFELDQDLDFQEKKIKSERGFMVLNHSLEFFGICKKCHLTRD